MRIKIYRGQVPPAIPPGADHSALPSATETLNSDKDPAPTLEQKQSGPTGVKRFNTSESIGERGVESFREIKNKEGEVVDVQDVKIRGYLTTWQDVTPKDRDGEYVIKGAFKSTIPAYMQNPVLLCDHRNLTANLAGRITEMREDSRGVYFEAMLSNSEQMKSVRRDVVDGHLRTVSMGGAFRYAGKGITEVALYESTLTPVPANPDARFTVSELSDAGRKYLANGGSLAGLKSVDDGQSKPTVELKG